MAVLNALIPMGVPLLKAGGGDLSGFPELMMVMHTLAAAGNGTGHLHLFQATTAWLDLWSVMLPVLGAGYSGCWASVCTQIPCLPLVLCVGEVL